MISSASYRDGTTAYDSSLAVVDGAIVLGTMMGIIPADFAPMMPASESSITTHWPGGVEIS